MKKLLFLFPILILLSSCASSDAIIKLGSLQSMCITGKGPGQDGAINPYTDGNSIARVKNLGENNFSIRIQNKGKIIDEINIRPRERKEVLLLKGHELYFDTETPTQAKVTFKDAAD